MLAAMGNSAFAAEAPLHLNVNGTKLADQKPVIIDQSILVPIRTISQLPGFHVDWDNKSKTVSVTNGSTQDVLKLTVGKTKAVLGASTVTVSVPPRNIGSSVYVPLRFIAESLNAYAAWDAESRTAVVYPFPASEEYKSEDLAASRQAVLGLPKISLKDHLGFTPDVRTTTYYFPQNQSQKFFIQEGEYIRYFEVENGAAWQRWEGQAGAKKAGERDAVPNLVPAVKGEWGKRPAYSGAYVYFMHEWMAGEVRYGLLDETGEGTELGSKEGVFDRVIIFPIDGEKGMELR